MTSPNIVTFGPAHVGKSTLIGYLLVKSGAYPNWASEVEKIKEEIGPEYDKGQKYAYLLDTGKNERIRGVKKGTTQIMHTARITFDETYNWLLIDTPGSQHNERERLKGMFYGDIGVFIIEPSKLLKFSLNNDESLLQEFFAPLIAWNKFERTRKLVVAISKMDVINYDQKIFDDAKKIINIVLGDSASLIPIVPISIDVDHEKENNIMQYSENFNWYVGNTFIETIKELVSSPNPHDSRSISFMSIDRSFEKKGHSMVLRGKVLKGYFNKNSKIKISPVKTAEGRFTTINANIKSIKEEKSKDDSDIAREGGIISFSISQISKSDIDLLRSSIIIPESIKLSTGSIIEFETKSIYTDNIISLNKLVKILWFGKLLTGNIIFINKAPSSDKLNLFIELNSITVSMPLNLDNNFDYQKFYIKCSQDEKNIYGEFISVNLKNIFSSVRITYNKETIIDSSGNLIIDFNKYKLSINYEDNKLISFVSSESTSIYDVIKIINSHSEGKKQITPMQYDWIPAKIM